MKITLDKSKYHRFRLYYDYTPDRVEFCRQLKESFGWDRFSFYSEGNQKFWAFTDSLFIPVLAEKFPEVDISPEAADLVKYEQRWEREKEIKNKKIEDIRSKTDTDFAVKGLKNELYPYQKIGVEFLVESEGRAIIADGMGLGKTCQAISFAKHMNFKRVLVVCPASVKFSWKNEVSKWTRFSSIVIDSKTDVKSIDSEINMWIVNYDILKKHYAQLSKIRFDCMIGDEVQMIKTTSAIRTKAFRMISKNISSIVLLSGTPLLSRPSELFSLLNIIDPKSWDNWFQFAKKYCAMHQTRWGLDTSGASNIEELHSRIKRYFIRRDKSQVLKELPEKTFIDVPVQLDKENEKRYTVAAQDLAKYLRKYAGKEKSEIGKAMAAEKLTQLNILRQINAVGKLGTAKELIESVLNSGEKVLVFCSFVEPLEILKEYFGDSAVIITGKTPVEERGGIVDAFQNNKDINIFLGGYKSAGVGITLTAASNFIGLDYPWNPADLQQAIDRLHRPGQKASAVNVYQLAVIDSIDEDMKDTIDHKQGIFDQVIEGKVSVSVGKDAMDSAVKRVLSNY